MQSRAMHGTDSTLHRGMHCNAHACWWIEYVSVLNTALLSGLCLLVVQHGDGDLP